MYSGKKPRDKKDAKVQEFPEEPLHDPLDDEADICIKNMLATKKADEDLKKNVGVERYYGNMEYKLTLFDKAKERLKHLTTQLNFRLNEGKGQAIYRVGIEDNGNPIGITDEHLEGSLSTSDL